ncbi:excalibur calcium-binding domain-containing protein [Bacillus cytotoxicus]|uniref:excalibur calcium-binding domain-containing protein n=1 Tax=unclassified Bacillus cereus group TaxID=2750818 RepID=UPI001F584B1A|nr:MULTISPECIES: excalibur calcium-binding domain-containing protein [unclassified Bacillus cereus group]EMA6342365.1 excalibur calcium-binding domain-containing protein [Bacillus cytotoxicus]
MKKLFVLLPMFLMLTVGYHTAIYAAKNPEDKNCGHFKNKQEVMEFWQSRGYNTNHDPHGLDKDHDGLPCEVKKGEYDQFLASKKESEKNGDKQEEAKQNLIHKEDKQKNIQQEQREVTKETTKREDRMQQGEQLPNTASNSFTIMLVSAVIVLIGFVLMLRRKPTNE